MLRLRRFSDFLDCPAQAEEVIDLATKLILQLQQVPADQRRPRPTIDVYPASLIAGPLVTARYINRFPRIFGARGELGPRDLILVKSEDYDTGMSESEEDEENASGRREPVAVLSPVRGLDCDEIVLDDGSVWTARQNHKGDFNFDHVDKHGIKTTARWVRRNSAKSTSTTPSSRSMSPSPPSSAATTTGCSPTLQTEYKYTFSIINPLTRRHPILASLTPSSLEVFEDYTTVSSSQCRNPPTRPTRPMSIDSYAAHHSLKSSPQSLMSIVTENGMERKTCHVDGATQKLIVVSGLWLFLRLSGRMTPAAVSPEAAAEVCGEAPNMREPSPNTHSCVEAVRMPRRKTTSGASSKNSIIPSVVPAQASGIRRAMSTGAAFMQRRMRHNQSHASEANNGSYSQHSYSRNTYNHHSYSHNHNTAAVAELDEVSIAGLHGSGSADDEVHDIQPQSVRAVNAVGTSTPTSTSSSASPKPQPCIQPQAQPQAQPQLQTQTQVEKNQQTPTKEEKKEQKRSRRVSWFRKLRH
ncbi:hypothetical protein SLS53_001569 [Cytospora paraplurivora]|uniref:Uncharacterized protein n=1 Tax=Cytospora paraplurivora TaxID=2898453 RepID=A0AAN9UHY5_9PEZI